MGPKSRRSISGDREEQEYVAMKLVELLNDDHVLEKLRKALFPQALAIKIDTLTDQIARLNDQLDAKDARIRSLEEKVRTLETANDNVEQYTRRANLRFHGLPEATEGEDTNEKILAVINGKMGMNPPVLQCQIERSHRIGRRLNSQGRTRERPIIVRFTSEKVRDDIYRARTKLREFNREHRDNPIFINEDLTACRAKLAYETRKLKQQKKISDCWTSYTKEVDISGNSLGPQGFRIVMLSLRHNTFITSLQIANNHADTDSAECIGEMLSENNTLKTLDVSGNNLGLDYFSRCVGPALEKNKCLSILRCESIGSQDLTVFAKHLQNNSSLVELNLSHNNLTTSSTQAFTKALASWLQQPTCQLHSLFLKNTNLSGNDLLADGQNIFTNNESLREVNISGNRMTDLRQLCHFLQCCMNHPRLTSLICDDLKIDDTNQTVEDSSTKLVQKSISSTMSCLSLMNNDLNDDFLTSLASQSGEFQLPNLEALSLGNNPRLSVATVIQFVSIVTDLPNQLQKFNWSLNNLDGLLDLVKASPQLEYLNLRLAIVDTSTMSQLLPHLAIISTLVLDGIKMAGTGVLCDLLGSKHNNITALSLAGCQLTDKDILPLADAVKARMSLKMLKLAVNRIGDRAIKALITSLLTRDTHPLQLVDLANNKITSVGAKYLSDLLTSAKHTSQIHSLNLNNNCIDSEGLFSLLSALGHSSLTSIQLSSQETPIEDTYLQNVYGTLARSLGFADNNMKPGCSDLPELPAGLSVKLLHLGGTPGELGRLLDCAAIMTDNRLCQLPYLSFEDALQLASALKLGGTPSCLVSNNDWNYIIGSQKGAPSWLQVRNLRERAMYVSHLPVSVSTSKLEGLLEMEADCNVQEVCLMKDLVTRANNGLAWVLMKDTLSVLKAKQFFNNGEAQVFGQPFIICSLPVNVDDEASKGAEVKAIGDMAVRAKERHKEQAAHKLLIEDSYATSQARHAYRLAHPAYADGRIW